MSSATKDFIRGLRFDAEDTLHRPPIHIRRISLESPHENYLIAILHHVLYDGISLPMLFDYVKAVYNGEFPLTAQFFTLARRIISLEARSTDYWESRLKGLHSWTFPRKVCSTADAWRASKVVNVPKGAIDRFCRRYGVSAQSIVQAAWAKVLATYSKPPDVVYGQMVSGRMLTGSDKVIGPMFVSTHFIWERTVSLDESRIQFLAGLPLGSNKQGEIWCALYTSSTWKHSPGTTLPFGGYNKF